MNREQVLNELVETLERWPSSIADCNYKDNEWTWSRCDGTFILIHRFEDPIVEQDWLHATGKLAKPAPNDAVHQPKHYGVLDGVESIQIIASSMTRDEWRGFCMGNIMKYRMRAGKKDALQQDIDKANEYEMLFDKYKEINRAKR